VFVKEAIRTLIHEGTLGLLLTSIMILIFLGSFRATSAVFLSIPLSALATFVVLYNMGSTLNTMILGGLALAFSRIIDNSVISLENIYRHLEEGAAPAVAAERGGTEVNMAVLAATLTTVIVFFPVTFLYGVSKFLFSALALAVAISLFVSYAIAMTVIPLFCSRYLKTVPLEAELPHREYEVEPTIATDHSRWERFTTAFNREFNRLLDFYENWVKRALNRPGLTVAALSGAFVLSLGIAPFLGLAFFPRTDAGQFTINVKAPTGTRIELTEKYVEKVENLIKNVVGDRDLKLLVSNIGVAPGFSSMYTSNSGPYTATIQVALKDSRRLTSFDYMDRVQQEIRDQFPELRAFFSSGSMVDAILNMGMPAPIDVQVSGRHPEQLESVAQNLAGNIRGLKGVGQVYIPQDVDYPGLRLVVDRVHAGELGLTQKEVVDNVITALNSDYMIAPNYWLDRKSGNDYFLTVQYYEHGRGAVHNAIDLTNIPIRAPNLKQPTTLNTVAKLEQVESPTEIDHYQIQPAIDIYVTPKEEDLESVASGVHHLVDTMNIPSNVHVDLRGMVNGMNESFRSFGLGLLLSILLLYLILVAQFRSFVDPLLIMLAIPMGFIGVLIVLPLTGTTLNVMSLMGVLMLVGISASNSILIVEFAHRLEKTGLSVKNAVITSCRVRLRPILMTSLATIIGMVPMAFKMGTGSEQYAPLARAIIGGLAVSVVLTVFIVPAAYLLVYGRRQSSASPAAEVTQ
jgi:multidrug efflux pump subunit AcrB